MKAFGWFCAWMITVFATVALCTWLISSTSTAFAIVVAMIIGNFYSFIECHVKGLE